MERGSIHHSIVSAQTIRVLMRRSWVSRPPMVLSTVSVVGMAALGIGFTAGIAILVAISLVTLVLVALINTITMLGRLLDTLDD